MGYWITESTTYKIHAETEGEARKIWLKHWDEGVSWTQLPMAIKDGSVEADWDWQGEGD